MDQPSFEILPTEGIKAFINEGGSISLSQYNPYFDNDPNIVVIEPYQILTVISWLEDFKEFIEGQNHVMGKA
jgi:hypothetical protein